MKFSVIVTSRAFSDNLKECLEHLKKVKYYDFEVIIVLDNFQKINFGRGENRFTIIPAAQNQFSPGEKRNLAAKAATGDILAFIDDDAYPDMYWLRNAANIFEADEKLYALGGPAVTPPGVEFLERMSGKVLESVLTSASTNIRHTARPEQDIDDFPTVNLFVRKEAFEKVGGFDAKYWPGEDTKLCQDLVTAYGAQFKYSPKVLVFHHRRKLFKPYFEQISRYGRYRGAFARIFKGSSRKPTYFIPSVFLFGLVLGPLAGLLLRELWYIYFVIIFIYFVLVFTESQKATVDDGNIAAFIYVFAGIIGSHFYYGLNFIKGFMLKNFLELRPVDSSGNYIGG